MQEMLTYLNNEQLLALQESLERHLVEGNIKQKHTNHELLQLFITAKQVEGCSLKTLRYYQRTVENLFGAMTGTIIQLSTCSLLRRFS